MGGARWGVSIHVCSYHIYKSEISIQDILPDTNFLVKGTSKETMIDVSEKVNEFIKREDQWLRNGGKFIVPFPKFKIYSKK